VALLRNGPPNSRPAGSRAHIRKGLLSPRYGWVTAGDSISGRPRARDIPTMPSSTSVSLALLLAVAACATPHPAPSPAPASAPSPTVAPAPSPTAEQKLPNDVKWVRTSAEYRALARQAYAIAGDRLPELTRGIPAQGWAVILDADETVLDNSEYQRRLAVANAPFDPKSWTAWVNERAALPIAGAPEFTKRVHSLGGRVVIVTNRSQAECEPTRANLQQAGIDADMVLCQPQGEENKNLRFQRVQNGSAMPGVPALSVVEWVGDNIQDFPNLTQAARTDSTTLGEFGKRFFIIPNPMYGSWEHVH
jgi:5'-nucleotidase (lipoprotein e(P4) family)